MTYPASGFRTPVSVVIFLAVVAVYSPAQALWVVQFNTPSAGSPGPDGGPSGHQQANRTGHKPKPGANSSTPSSGASQSVSSSNGKVPSGGFGWSGGSGARDARSACVASAGCEEISPDGGADETTSPGDIVILAEYCEGGECVEGENSEQLLLALADDGTLSGEYPETADAQSEEWEIALGESSGSNIITTSNSTGGDNTPARIETEGGIAGAIKSIGAENTGTEGAATQNVPEPAVLGLVLLGVLAYTFVGRRRLASG